MNTLDTDHTHDAAPRVEHPKPTTPISASAAIMALCIKILQRLKPNLRTFTTVVTSSQELVPREASGLVRYLHNPTAAPITLTLVQGVNSNQTPIFSASLAAGAVQNMKLAFNDGLLCVAGAGCVVSGEMT